jgi:hypothetical protein
MIRVGNRAQHEVTVYDLHAPGLLGVRVQLEFDSAGRVVNLLPRDAPTDQSAPLHRLLHRVAERLRDGHGLEAQILALCRQRDVLADLGAEERAHGVAARAAFAATGQFGA